MHPQHSAPLIFVVDDDYGMRSALRRLLRAAGFEVETYPSAQALLDQCNLDRSGVLLLDVMMPVMNGLELQAALLARSIDLPIVFLTGSSSISMAVTAMRRGAADFLEKPVDNVVLVERVRQSLRRATAKPRTRVSAAEYERRRRLLTPREEEVMQQIVTGNTSKATGRMLGVSHRTVEIHRTRLMNKMQATSLAELVTMTLAHDSN
jgi:FixJ family two-component response regulator